MFNERCKGFRLEGQAALCRKKGACLMKRSEKFWQWVYRNSGLAIFGVLLINYAIAYFVLESTMGVMDTCSCIGVLYCGSFVIGVPLARRWFLNRWRSDAALSGAQTILGGQMTQDGYSHGRVIIAETELSPVERSRIETVTVIILRLMLVMVTIFIISRSHFRLSIVSHSVLLVVIFVEGIVLGYWIFRIKYRNRLYEMKGV